MAKGKYRKWLEPEGLSLLEGWARDGLTDEQIAKKMGCGSSTLYEWKQRYPEISESLKKGKEIIDYEVENALLKRALGYDVTETREEIERVEGGIPKRREIKTVRHIPPDTTAQIFWLKNRKRDDWNDRQNIEISRAPEDDSLREMKEYFEQRKESGSGPPVE